MLKKGLGLTLLLTLTLLVTSYALLVTGSFADDQQQGETFTITTYYPSPYGSYNELSTNKFAVGYNTSGDQPDRDGDIRLKPQIGDPAIWVNGKEGEIAYSSTKDTLYVNNGSSWVAQGAGGTIYTIECSWSCSGLSWGSCTSSCTPPDCASGFTSLGVGCVASGGGVAENNYYGNIFNGYGHCKRICYKG